VATAGTFDDRGSTSAPLAETAAGSSGPGPELIEEWQPGPVSRTPVLVVLGIVAVIAIGGALLAVLGASPKQAAPTSVSSLPGVSLRAVPAAHALAAITAAGQPPADIVADLVVPEGATVTGSSDLDAGVGQFDRGVSMTVDASTKEVVAFFSAELRHDGWAMSASEPVTNKQGVSGTEVLAQHESADGYYWEVGVVVDPANPSITPALAGSGAAAESSSVELTLLEVGDAN
jgi:hypothetical protein